VQETRPVRSRSVVENILLVVVVACLVIGVLRFAAVAATLDGPIENHPHFRRSVFIGVTGDFWTTDLAAWVAARFEAWLEDPPTTGPDGTRRGFLTYADVRRTLDDDPAREATPCADLQMHTTWSDGTLPLEEMVQAARSLGGPFVAVTDHSQALTIANGMTPAELAEQARAIDALNVGFEANGDAFRVPRPIGVRLVPAGPPGLGAPRPSRLLVSSQMEPSGSRATLRTRPNV